MKKNPETENSEKITFNLLSTGEVEIRLVETIPPPDEAAETPPADGTGRKKGTRDFLLPADYGRFFCDEGSGRLRETVEGRNAVITGRGPLEAYFALGYYLTRAGAARIRYKGPHGEQYVLKETIPAVPSDKPWLSFSEAESVQVCTFRPSEAPKGHWPLSDEVFTAPARLPPGEQPLVVTGAAASPMYAHLGISAALAGKLDIRTEKPDTLFAVRFAPDGVETMIRSGGRRNGIVVGVLGDPNSGKSVFSRAFQHAVRHVMPGWYVSWTYDCDYSSPTPDWYLSGKGRKDSDDGVTKARESIKANWTPELDLRVRDKLDTLRHSLDLTIADMPGGRHNDNKDLHDRIPLYEGETADRSVRGRMMAACDAFIVICKTVDKEGKPVGDSIFEGWRDALAVHGLADRIVARIDSSDPKAAFSAAMVSEGPGAFRYAMQGLDRENDAGLSSLRMASVLEPLVRYISCIPVARAARAAVAKAFLTKDAGTRYGAAARSAATGRIFTAGQYASWNHSTNIHAEMGALLQSAMEGEPDVDVLAVASTSAGSASPCGVCRQVMAEHARRTGRDFDVALVPEHAWFSLHKVSELLPHTWEAHPESPRSNRPRVFLRLAERLTDTEPETGGEYIENAMADRINLVWDARFMPGSALVKTKYERVGNDSYRKLPHAFTEAALYQRYLRDRRLADPVFLGAETLRLPVGKEFRCRNPRPFEGEFAELLDHHVFGPCGLQCARSVRLMCSRMLGMHTDDSDYDLLVSASPDRVAAVRRAVADAVEAGVFRIPAESGSLRLLASLHPTSRKEEPRPLYSSGRYAETFVVGSARFSFMFVEPGVVPWAFPFEARPLGRTAIAGIVADASRTPFKRSEALLVRENGERIRLLCYHKGGNLLKEEDSISATGLLYGHKPEGRFGCDRTLLLLSLDTDRIVWLP